MLTPIGVGFLERSKGSDSYAALVNVQEARAFFRARLRD